MLKRGYFSFSVPGIRDRLSRAWNGAFIARADPARLSTPIHTQSSNHQVLNTSENRRSPNEPNSLRHNGLVQCKKLNTNFFNIQKKKYRKKKQEELLERKKKRKKTRFNFQVFWRYYILFFASAVSLYIYVLIETGRWLQQNNIPERKKYVDKKKSRKRSSWCLRHGWLILYSILGVVRKIK